MNIFLGLLAAIIGGPGLAFYLGILIGIAIKTAKAIAREQDPKAN